MTERNEKSAKELETELLEQVMALRSSANAYDCGSTWEAKRLSTHVYTLCHDWPGSSNKSLLKLLGLKDNMSFCSTMEHNTPFEEALYAQACQKSEFSPLIYMSFCDGQIEFRACKGIKRQNWITFEEWYSEEIFPKGTLSLTRGDIVRTMRSQDGGSHVDKTITNPSYRKFQMEGDPLMKRTKYDLSTGEIIATDLPVERGVHAIMRQIAWELDTTLISKGI